jgi:integrase
MTTTHNAPLDFPAKGFSPNPLILEELLAFRNASFHGHDLRQIVTANTVGEAAELWLARGLGRKGPWAQSTRERYGRIVQNQLEASPHPSLPPIASVRWADLTVDMVADWSIENGRTLAPTTAVIALITLKCVCAFAVRKRWLATNPVLGLEDCEKPRWEPGSVGILEGQSLGRVLNQAGKYRPLFELLAFTGLRIGEALGLTWADVDFESDLLVVHRQLTRHRVHGPLKTPNARREIVLSKPTVKLLRSLWAASEDNRGDDFIFTNGRGRPLDYRKVGEGFRVAVRESGVWRGNGRLSLHSLRHGFASLLIAEGLNILFVSRQLGHSSPHVTYRVYSHYFERAKNACAARSALEAGYAAITSQSEPARLSLVGAGA